MDALSCLKIHPFTVYRFVKSQLTKPKLSKPKQGPAKWFVFGYFLFEIASNSVQRRLWVGCGKYYRSRSVGFIASECYLWCQLSPVHWANGTTFKPQLHHWRHR